MSRLYPSWCEALQIVYDLAQGNALDEDTVDEELKPEAEKQQAALALVRNYLVSESLRRGG